MRSAMPGISHLADLKIFANLLLNCCDKVVLMRLQILTSHAFGNGRPRRGFRRALNAATI
jgi:hypothetical protein